MSVRPRIIGGAAAAAAALALCVALVARAAGPDPLSAPSLMADVRTYAALAPDHLSGTAASGTTQTWMAKQLRAAGLRTGADAFSFFRFTAHAVSLTVDGRPVPSVAPRLYSGTTPAAGLAAPLAYAGLGTGQEMARAAVKDRIAVVDVPYNDGATAPTLEPAIGAAKAAGAAALVAVTEGPQDYPVHEDVDSRAGLAGLPVVFVGKRSGAAVIDAAKAGARGRLTLTADVGPGCDSDVYGVLPGADPTRFVVIGTPTGAFVPSASERGAGVAILLALARHYAQLPVAQRPVTLVFAALAGHEAGYLGLPVLMREHPAWFAGDAYFHLGASLAARAMTEAPNGTVASSDAGDPTRLLYVSENPLAQAIAQKDFAAAQMGSAAPGVRNVGEQAYAYHAGVPVISSSGASYEFHTQGDQSDGVSPALLAAVADGFRAAIDDVGALPAGALRGANGVAAALGARQQPGATPGGGNGTPDPAKEPAPVAACGAPASSTHAYDDRGQQRPTGPAAGLALVPTYEDPQPALGWEGDWQSRSFSAPSRRTGAMLSGTIFAPRPLPPAGTRLPLVVIGPGSGPGVETMYHWSARDLAGHGYIALAIDPQGVGRSETFPRDPAGCHVPSEADPKAVCDGVPFQQAGNYVDALQSGIDYGLSKANPWRAVVDGARIGIAGHSLAARAASYLQGVDHRVGALVAWDNLASDLQGDAGSPSGGGAAGSLIGGELPGGSMPVTPRVPALGEANDKTGTTEPANTDPDQKKTAFSTWRAAGQPAMQVVFTGSGHLDWAQAPSNRTAAKEAELKLFEYYTRAWFDRWLRGDTGADRRLLARTVDGKPVGDVLSDKWRSGAAFDGRDCADVRAGCP